MLFILFFQTCFVDCLIEQTHPEVRKHHDQDVSTCPLFLCPWTALSLQCRMHILCGQYAFSVLGKRVYPHNLVIPRMPCKKTITAFLKKMDANLLLLSPGMLCFAGYISAAFVCWMPFWWAKGSKNVYKVNCVKIPFKISNQMNEIKIPVFIYLLSNHIYLCHLDTIG